MKSNAHMKQLRKRPAKLKVKPSATFEKRLGKARSLWKDDKDFQNFLVILEQNKRN